MAPSLPEANLLNLLGLDEVTAVLRHLDLRDLVRVGQTCKLLRHGDGGLETAELPTKSPVVMTLRDLAFSDGELVPSTRPIGCSESWVAYLARCVRRCLGAPAIAAGDERSLFVAANGPLLACGNGGPLGDYAGGIHSNPTPMATIAGIRVRSIAASGMYCLALTWDRRVYSWGQNRSGEPGQGDMLTMPTPTLEEGLEDVRGIAVATFHSLAVTRSGEVFSWGQSFQPAAQHSLQAVLVEGFDRVRLRSVCAGDVTAFAIGEAGELSSWDCGHECLLGHGNTQNQRSPKRVEVLRGIRVSSVVVGVRHALALTDDGLVYAWGENYGGALLGNTNSVDELVPTLTPVEALQGVRVTSVAAIHYRSYAVADTGELWAWGTDGFNLPPLGHGEHRECHVPKPIDSLRGVKVNAVALSEFHTLALVDDGSVYAWGSRRAAESGALGLGASVSDRGKPVPTPQRVPGLRVACGQ
jgi:alpha-tubulin suppressor-like RCC1 family protein